MQSSSHQLSTSVADSIYIKKYICKKIPSLMLRMMIVWGKILDWCKVSLGFDPSLKHFTCLTTLKSCNATKQSVCGLYIYIYMYIYLNAHLLIYTYIYIYIYICVCVCVCVYVWMYLCIYPYIHFIEYCREKENSSYPAVFPITDYLTSTYQWSIIKIAQKVVFVLYKHLPL